MAVAGALGDSTVSLGNGCLCCAVDASELDVYLERLARPAAGIDVVVIEASGLAEPQELVRMLLASSHPGIVYGGLVEVVDAAEFDGTRARHPEIDRHLALADLVVVNKIDRAPDAERVLAGAHPHRPGGGRPGHLRPGRPGVPLRLPAERGAPRAAVLRRPAPSRRRRGRHAHRRARRSSARRLRQRVLCLRSPSRPAPVDALPRQQARGPLPDQGVRRLRAHDTVNRYAVHAVGRFLRFYPEPWSGASGEARLSQLVLIGSGIDAPALVKELEACGSDAPHTADEHGMWGVLRYVQDPRTGTPRTGSLRTRTRGP